MNFGPPIPGTLKYSNKKVKVASFLNRRWLTQIIQLKAGIENRRFLRNKYGIHLILNFLLNSYDWMSGFASIELPGGRRCSG